MSSEKKCSTSFWCPHPWGTLSAKANGELRVCCLADYNDPKPVKDKNGNILTVENLKNVDTYFNSPGLVSLRKEMMDGGRPEMCRRCVEIEDAGGMTERSELAAVRSIDDYLKNTNLETGELLASQVKYIDFAFSNNCNLKCKMCSPWASDQLAKEFKQMGRVNVEMSFDYKGVWSFDNNIKAIMEQVMGTLEDLIIVGGEPLINQDLIKCLKLLNESGYADKIFLRITTNLTVLPKQFFEIVSKFKWVHFIVSIDAIGPMFDYIRFPGKWERIEKNLNDLLAWDFDRFQVEFSTCFMSWNLLHIPELLDHFSKYAGHPKMREWVPWFNYVFGPGYARPEALPLEVRQRAQKIILESVEKNKLLNCTKQDLAKLAMLEGYAMKMMEEDFPHDRMDFFKYTLEQDKLRNINTEDFLPYIKEYAVQPKGTV